MKEGYSFRQMIKDITRFHIKKVAVGTLNHSNGTLAKFKDALVYQVKLMVKNKLATPLNCTGRLRPVLECIDKMTHNQTTGQMQVAIVPLVNDHELFTAL